MRALSRMDCCGRARRAARRRGSAAMRTTSRRRDCRPRDHRADACPRTTRDCCTRAVYHRGATESRRHQLRTTTTAAAADDTINFTIAHVRTVYYTHYNNTISRTTALHDSVDDCG